MILMLFSNKIDHYFLYIFSNKLHPAEPGPIRTISQSGILEYSKLNYITYIMTLP